MRQHSIDIGIHEHDKPLRVADVQLQQMGWVVVHIGDFPNECNLYFRSVASAIEFADGLRDKLMAAVTHAVDECVPDLQLA